MARSIRLGLVVDAIQRLCGIDPARDSMTALELQRMGELITERVREAYEETFWPETMTVEQRQFRATWASDTNYIADDEVYYDGNYYVAQAASIGEQPDTDDGTYWSAVTRSTFEASIDYEQAGETEIFAVDHEACLYEDNPLTHARPIPLTPVETYADRFVLLTDNVPALPYVRFQTYPPEFSLEAWSAATQYAANDLAYYATTEECYIAIQANQNKNPYTETDDWQPVSFPLWMRTFVQHAVASDLRLDDEGRYREQGRAKAELNRLHEAKILVPRVRRRPRTRTFR